MLLTGKLMTAFCVFLLSGAIPVHAQLGGEQQDATRILNGMPPDVLAKVRSLAQIIPTGHQRRKNLGCRDSTRLDVRATWREVETVEPRGRSASRRNQ